MSFRNWGFCDLSVSKNIDLTKLDIIKKFGYSTIALNTYIEETGDEPKKKKKKGELKEKQDAFPAPIEINKDVIDKCGLNILQRITIEFSDSSIAHKMNQSDNLKKYDLIAVIPKTLGAFQYTCSTMDIDLISFEPEVRIPFKVSRKLYQQAVDRGVFFELMYAPAVKDSTSRKNIIIAAHSYHAVGKSKNIVVTSNADNYAHFRGVYDIINLGFIYGMNNNQSLESIRNNARRLILKSESRRTGKLYVAISINNEENETKNKI